MGDLRGDVNLPSLSLQFSLPSERDMIGKIQISDVRMQKMFLKLSFISLITVIVRFSVTLCCVNLICLHKDSVWRLDVMQCVMQVSAVSGCFLCCQALWFDPDVNGVCLRSSRAAGE